ncbi:MAG: tetratricopeptide repeat protein, partial [Planctomycetaceae bacterium]|nr:tetratricopeptide repeat protein [Planctomycetaceae bacterium]
MTRSRATLLLCCAATAGLVGGMLARWSSGTSTTSAEAHAVEGPGGRSSTATSPVLGATPLATHSDSADNDGQAVAGGTGASETPGPVEDSPRDESLRCPAPDVASSVSATGQLDLVDQRMLAGSYASALRLLEQLRAASQARDLSQYMLRIGHCHEAIGKWDSAIAGYDEAARTTTSPDLQVQAVIGKVRCWTQTGRSELAIAALYQLALGQSSSSSRVTGEVWHLLGNTLAQSYAGPSAGRTSLDDQELFGTAPRSNTADFIAALNDPSIARSLNEGRRQAPAELLQRLGDSPPEVFVRVSFVRTPVTQILSWLSATAGWEVRASSDLSRTLAGRVQSWHVDAMDAATLLDAVLSGLDVGWTWGENVLTLWSIGGGPEAVVERFRREQTHRALQQAATQAPDHRWCCHTYLNLGRLAAESGQLAEALRLHELGLGAVQSPECELELLLNASRLRLRLGERTAALQSAYRSVDISGTHPLRSLGYLLVGRLLLENGESRSAVPELVRGLALCEGTPLESRAACLLASAYLLAGNPHGANAVLMKRGPMLRGGAERDVAAFLSALSRYDAAATVEERGRAAPSLMESVSHIDPAAQYGGHWWTLCSRALDETGLTEEAKVLRNRCLTSAPRFPLRDKILLARV